MRNNNKGRSSKPKNWKKNKDSATNKEIANKLKGEDERACPASSAMNDLSWYVVDEQVLNDSARIPYSIPVGMPLTRNASFTEQDMVDPAYDDAIPGILVSHLMPILGNAQDASDPVNVAANSIYQFVRSKISGSRPYDAVDFMIYLGAMDSVFTYCTWLSRAYATVFTYHQANRYLSRALIEAQDIDYDDLVANLSAFRQMFNVKIAKIKSLYVPSNMSIFIRHAWMFSKYYIEGDTEKDQIYCHAPEGYYLFDLDNDGAGCLKSKAIDTTTKLKVSDLLTILDNMLDPIYADEDFNRISGDLLKAYENNVFTISEIPDIATVNLEFSEEVLLQFKNAKFCMVDRDSNDNTEFVDGAFSYYQDSTKRYLKFTMTEDALSTVRAITQSTNTLTHVSSSSSTELKHMLCSKFQNWSKPMLLTSPHRDVTPGENMINTRLVVSLDISADRNNYWYGKINDITVGTEWPVRYTIHTFHRDKVTHTLSLFRRIYDYSLYLDTDINLDVQQVVASQYPILSSFKYHPELWVDFYLSRSPSNRFVNSGRSLIDVDNYALVDFNLIKGIHNAAILGQYNVPKLSIGG